MRRTPKMRVFVASGYFDMLSKPASVAAQITKGGLPMDRVTLKNYESGHMLYLGETEQAFTNDLRSWMLSHP
jgi:carboxypeptidase C (cathepsin A)